MLKAHFYFLLTVTVYKMHVKIKRPSRWVLCNYIRSCNNVETYFHHRRHITFLLSKHETHHTDNSPNIKKNKRNIALAYNHPAPPTVLKSPKKVEIGQRTRHGKQQNSPNIQKTNAIFHAPTIIQYRQHS
jgi:hypothetical protein